MNATPRRTSLGERGPSVKAWQEFLVSKGYDLGKPDGIHGARTEAASVDFESKARGKIAYTSEQKRAIDSVLSIFETGRLPSAASYSTCTVLKDGAGISYGKHQCTDRAGSLDLVCKRYIELGGAESAKLSAFLPQLSSNESAKVNPAGPFPGWLKDLITLLKKIGSEPVMQQAQDEVFDRVYFEPAVLRANDFGLLTALSLLVLYDTCIHSGPARVMAHASQLLPATPSKGGDEKIWVREYVSERRAWLSRSSNELVRKTVYRPNALLKLIEQGNWDLRMPFTCCGKTVV